LGEAGCREEQEKKSAAHGDEGSRSGMASRSLGVVEIGGGCSTY
jgi:hypothetical protein